MSNLDNEIHNPYAGNASYVGLARLMSRRETAPYNAHHVVGILAKEEARKDEAPSTIRSKVGTGG